jgi:hypothetical protein
VSAQSWRRHDDRAPLFFPENHPTVAVIAGEFRGLIWAHCKLPDLEFLARDARILPLNYCDLIEKPVGARLVGDILGAVGEQYSAVDPLAIPVFSVRELRRALLRWGPLIFRAITYGGSCR